MFKKENLTIPNFLSLSRLIFLPLLFFYVLKDMRLAFLIGYVLLGATDFFDGLLARVLNQKTDIGKSLDSFADMFFYISSAYFIHKLYPDYLTPNRWLLIAFFVIFGLSLVVSSILCKKPIMMHTAVLKLNALLVYVLIIVSFFVNTTWFISVILVLYFIAFVEEIIIFIKYGEVDPDTLSVFMLKKKDERVS